MGISGNGHNPITDRRIVVGLDIGTSKICALVASEGEYDNELNILGIGITESRGVSRGYITNIESTVSSIKTVIAQAEQQSGVKIDEVIVGIAGDHIESQSTIGIIGIPNQSNGITQQDVLRVLDESRRVAIPSNRRILHVIPQGFIVDGQDSISDPVGFTGVRLEANVNLITANSAYLDTIYRCVERANIGIREVVLEPIASSISVLDEDEKEVGVALIDIGGGTTDIAIFREGILRFTSVIAVAGKKVTDDIQIGLGILKRDAEKIKKEFGHTYKAGIQREEYTMIQGINGREPRNINKQFLCDIIQPRMEEILEFASSEIERSGLIGFLGAGIVLTGGCSLIRGIDDLAADIFGMPIKIGSPSGITYSGLAPEVENPMYSTSVGLALYGLQDQSNNFNPNSKNSREEKATTKQTNKWTFFRKMQDIINKI